MARRDESILVKLLPQERRQLDLLAETFQRSRSDVVRVLLRQAAAEAESEGAQKGQSAERSGASDGRPE